MKKSILIGALAALMLFAFVACENSSAATGLVNNITAVQDDVFVVGEKAVSEGFTFTGYTTMGDVVTLDPADITLDGSELVKDSKNTYTIYYQGREAGTVDVEATPVTGFSVDATGATAEYYAVVTGVSKETARKIDLSGIVVTAEYDGGKKVVSNEIVVTDASSVTWAKAGKYDVKVSLKGLDTSLAKTYKIEVLENLVDEVVLKVTDDYVVYSDVQDQSTIKYNDGTTNKVGIYMEKNYLGGETAKVAETDIRYLDANNEYTIEKSTAISTANLSGLAVQAKYVGKDGIVNLVRTVSSPVITIKKDSVKSVEVAALAELKRSDYTLLIADPGFTVKPVMESGVNPSISKLTYRNNQNAATVTDNYYTITPANLLTGTAQVGDRVEITITAVMGDKTFTETVQTVLSDAGSASVQPDGGDSKN